MKSTLTESVGKLVIILYIYIYHYNTIIVDLICFIIGNEVSSSSKGLGQNWTNDEKENDSFDGSSAEGIDSST